MAQVRATILLSISLVILWGCSSGFLKSDKAESLKKVEEYDKALQVEYLEPPPTPIPSPAPEEKENADSDKTKDPKKAVKTKKREVKKKIKKKKQPIKKKKKKKAKKSGPAKHYPSLEDGEGWDGRRPIVDPFRVGEKVSLRLTYFGITAGYMTIEVAPFVMVKGRKAYHFKLTAKSNDFFSNIYRVEDWAETFLDYEDMVPYNYAIHVKESKQLKEIRSYIDWKTMKNKYWEKKITKEKGLEEKTREWDVKPFTQNVFSVAYYIRTFTLRPGKTIKVRVTDDKKNMVVTAKVLRQEILETDIGDLDTLVIEPKMAVEGIFKPMGEILFWVTNDDRKFIVKIQSAIRIGKIVGYLNTIEKGREEVFEEQ
jgi:hypothetical protein